MSSDSTTDAVGPHGHGRRGTASVASSRPTRRYRRGRLRRAVLGAADAPLGERHASGGPRQRVGSSGRNYMRHNNSAFMAISREPNSDRSRKRWPQRFLLSEPTTGSSRSATSRWSANRTAPQIKAEALPDFLQWFPDMPFDELARHAMDFWLMTEDLPLPENRVELKSDGRVYARHERGERRGSPAPAAAS